ncbi:MAG: hypothetical protein AAGC71_13120 [Pseudomonadota bacterium]
MTARIIAFVVSIVLMTSAGADEYSFEVAGFVNQEDTDTTITGNGDSVTLDSGADAVSLAGAWYYAGLSDDNGPWADASFVSRASSVFVAIDGVNETTSIAFSDPLLGTDVDIDVDTTTIGLGIQHIWADSGWFGIASIAQLEIESGTSADGDATQLLVGGGRYIGETTTLQLLVTDVDDENVGSTNIEAALRHVGRLNAIWQWGTVLRYGVSDASGDLVADQTSYGAVLNLYPTNRLALTTSLQFVDSDDDVDEREVGVAVSWFATRNIELLFRYASLRIDLPQDALNGNSVEAGINVRF